MGPEYSELIIFCENRFSFKYPEDGRELRTVGELYYEILRQIKESTNKVCFRPLVFFQLRKALAEETGLSLTSIRLESPVRELVPKRGRRKLWKLIDEGLDRSLPNLVSAIPGSVTFALCILLGFPLAFGLTVGLFALFGEAVPPLVAGVLGTGAVFGIPVLLALAFRLTEVHFPKSCASVNDVVDCVLRDEYGVMDDAGQPWREDSVWRKLAELTGAAFEVPPERISPTTDFVDDLGA